MNDSEVLKITDAVSWTGVLDPGLVTFDVVMETKFGTTYNSYFINAGKKTLIDTVKETFWPVYLEKLKRLTDISSIEYIVVNHTEPDHSGSLAHLLDLNPGITVVGSGNAIRYLNDLINRSFRSLVVKDGDVLDIGGGKTLRFIGAPNLHWPDTIYTYLEEDKVLFSCDSFGCHYCHKDMFDDLVGDFDDAFRYYFDVILLPYSKFMLKAIEKIRPLSISVICPGHGPILRSHWRKYVDLSQEYASAALENPKPNRILIAYVSAYKNTARMAESIAAGIRKAGDELVIDLCDLEAMPLSEVERHVTESSAIIIGSPIINQNILIQIYQLFAILNPIRDRSKLAGAFGSYGWSGDFMKILETNILNLKMNLFGEGLFVKFSPTTDDLKRCEEYGLAFGRKLLESPPPCS